MKILLINTLDNKGGAALLTMDLRQELKRRGHSVSMIVGYKYSDEKDIYVMPRYPGQARLNHWLADDIHFSPSNKLLKMSIYKEAEIIHCHNLHSSFFNLKTLKKISQEKPTLWTQHDLWAITSHYTSSISYQKNKPFRFLRFFWDNRLYLLKAKKKIYDHSSFTVISPSQWLKEKIKNSILGKHKIYLIKNGVNTEIFYPRKQKEIRKKLNLPIDKKIILFSANNGLKNQLKGSNYVIKMMEKFKDDSTVLFVSIGGTAQSINKNHLSVGYIYDKETLALYYAAADIFLYPSLADNCPLVVLESMACGTPVVSFDTDGIPEIIEDTRYGYIAKYQDTSDLEKGLKYILSLKDGDNNKMRASCARKIKEQYSLKKMADEYEKIYLQLRDKRRKIIE